MHVWTFWSLYLLQMGVGIRQSIADVDTDSLLSQNWPLSPPVHWRSCSETDSATTEKHGRKKTKKNAGNATEFLISVDLGKVWPPLTLVGPFGMPCGDQRSCQLLFSLWCSFWLRSEAFHCAITMTFTFLPLYCGCDVL